MLGGSCVRNASLCMGRLEPDACKAKKCQCCIPVFTTTPSSEVSTTLGTTTQAPNTWASTTQVPIDISSNAPSTGCPAGSSEVAGSCYLFNKLQNLPRRSWSDARSFCQSLSTKDFSVDLAVLGNFNDPQDDPLLNFMNNQSMWYTWFGVTYSSEENTWTWLDGRTLAANSSLWSPGQPNDEGNTNCGGFGRNKMPYFTLFDMPCSWTRDYACQIVAV
ncbi:unnamed protein product [Meganyctiphanes norvegica]|uniref:C-type lectin domain-containing protein n=1 Tax=Meganyctiphanes norvegica TaxID=48144 RepID=A0AAV2QIG5_MEGNR